MAFLTTVIVWSAWQLLVVFGTVIHTHEKKKKRWDKLLNIFHEKGQDYTSYLHAAEYFDNMEDIIKYIEKKKKQSKT